MDVSISPASPAAVFVLAVLGITLLAGALFFGYMAWLTASGTVHIDAKGIDLQIPFYGRQVAMEKLDLAASQVVEDVSSSSFKPTFRTNGVGLPGYQMGWFKLENGDRALVALGAGKRALAIPTREQFTLLLGVDSPADLQSTLKSLQAR